MLAASKISERRLTELVQCSNSGLSVVNYTTNAQIGLHFSEANMRWLLGRPGDKTCYNADLGVASAHVLSHLRFICGHCRHASSACAAHS